MNVNLGVSKAKGEFKVVLRDKNGKVTKETSWNNNLLLDKFFTSLNWGRYCYVGTGSTAPLPTDTKMAALLGAPVSLHSIAGSAAIEAGGSDADGYTYVSGSSVFRWDIGTIVGNISEFGISDSSNTTTYTLYVRSLIKDTNGDPTTITVTADDQLEIWWRLKKKSVGATQMIAGETTETFTLNGVSTQVECSTLNPALFSVLGNFDTNLGSRVISTVYGYFNAIKTVVLNTPASVSIRDAAAGDNLSTSSVNVEQYVAPVESLTNPQPGVAKITYTATFPLHAAAANSVMQCVVADIYGASNNTATTGSKVLAKATFNPQFIKGVDKILTIAFSYSVTRE